MLKKIYNKEQARIEKFLTGIMGMVFLFYVISCSVSTPSPQTTAPPSPGKLKKCAKATSVDLSWDVSTGATFYKLYRGDTEIGENITNTFYTDTNLTSGTAYTYKVQACSAAGCSRDSDSLTITTPNDKSFKSIIDSGKIPADLNSYDERSQEIFSFYNGNTSIVVKYLKPGDSGDGSSFEKAAGNLKTVLQGITDASAGKVYAVLLTEGNYKAGSQMAMKNHVAIIGGVDECLGFSDTATELDGNANHQVFNNNGLNNTALLYGVAVINGNKAEKGGGMYNYSSSPSLVGVTFSGNSATLGGGGMYNDSSSSPSLVGVTFSGNSATGTGTSGSGGGMFNQRHSSPSLEEVTFSENTANYQGGGMFNQESKSSLKRVTFSGNTAGDAGGGMVNRYYSSPSLEGVTLSGNTADYGGGMYNEISSPSLIGVTLSGNTADYGGGMYNDDSTPSLVRVTFSGNKANLNGGGMYNQKSSPSLMGVTFSGNKASFGGGMYNDNDGKDGALIVNGIFWGNTASSVGPQFYFYNDNNAQENLRIYNNIVEGGTGTLVSGTRYTSVNQGGFVSGGGSAPVVISFSNITNADPQLRSLADNGGSVLTHAIPSTSSAVDQGLYVKKSGTTLYYSVNNTDWYTNPMLTTAATLPAGAEDLTATDATGYDRTNRPDLGAYEYR